MKQRHKIGDRYGNILETIHYIFNIYIGKCYTAKIMVKIAIFCICFFLRAGISHTCQEQTFKLRMTLCVIVVFDEVVLQIELAVT